MEVTAYAKLQWQRIELMRPPRAGRKVGRWRVQAGAAWSRLVTGLGCYEKGAPFAPPAHDDKGEVEEHAVMVVQGVPEAPFHLSISLMTRPPPHSDSVPPLWWRCRGRISSSSPHFPDTDGILGGRGRCGGAGASQLAAPRGRARGALASFASGAPSCGVGGGGGGAQTRTRGGDLGH
jgi:hypothetical protein